MRFDAIYGEIGLSKNGYVFLPSVLKGEQCAKLRAHIDEHSKRARKARHVQEKKHAMFKRVFEHHPKDCLEVFETPTVRRVCQELIGICGSSRENDSCLKMHVIHNNAFRVDPGGRGQAPVWHTDDAPTFLTADGGPLPEGVITAPLVLTCMYFLNDIKGAGHGGTRVIPGSHRFGRPCTPDDAEKHARHFVQGPEGSVLIISSDVWHKGARVENNGATSPRYVFQVTYGRRLVGHKHGSIMNYRLPQRTMSVIEGDEGKKQLMGFLQGGAYS